MGLVMPGGIPVGGDFLAFYNAGLLFGKDPSRLYDFQAQWDQQKELFREYPKIAASPLPYI